ncbi:MAG: DUF6293 family protein, partial [Leptospiraceae bacterium]|nr:DUF6293 family protein [Leptospiraceae bacterium]
MSEIVHIIAVESNPSVILESIKTIGYPIHRSYIIYRKREAIENAENLSKALKSFVETKTISFEGNSVYEILWKLLEIVRAEKDKNNSVLINISDADRNLAVASIVAAQISGSKAYMLMNDKAEFIQTPPLKSFDEERTRILKALLQDGGSVESINKLIELVAGKIEDHRKYLAQRAR